MSDVKFEQEFLQGQRDCKAGFQPASQSEHYRRGYATQYESEQIDSALSIRQEVPVEH